MTSATCDAPESALLLFLSAGTLSDSERGRTLAHGSGCRVCIEDLAAIRALIRALLAAHLTSEEVVTTAWDGGDGDGHGRDCAPCRAELEDLRSMVAALRGGHEPTL